MIYDLELIDFCNHELSAYIRQNNKTGGYLLEIVTYNAIEIPPLRLNEQTAENIAYFCRSYLNAWDWAQKQQGALNG